MEMVRELGDGSLQEQLEVVSEQDQKQEQANEQQMNVQYVQTIRVQRVEDEDRQEDEGLIEPNN